MSDISCTICNRPEAHKCSVCHSVAYCGTECQETDWSLHKVLCKKLTPFLESQPRPEGAKLVIILPEEDKTPELRWVVYGASLGENQGYDLTALNTILGGRSLYKPLNRNIWRSTNITTHTVVTQWSDTLYGSRPFNACILNITAGPAQAKLTGPIAILSHTGKSDDDDAVYQDITLSDFSTAIGYLKFLGLCQHQQSLDAFPGQPFDFSVFRQRIAAKVSCLSEDGSAVVETLGIQHDHPIFRTRATSFSVAMGLPLLMHWSRHPKPKEDDNVSKNPWFDVAAMAMDFDADTASENWGAPANSFEPPVSGSFLVVRRDGKEFVGKVLMVVLGFLTAYVRKIVERWEDAGGLGTREERVEFQEKCLARDEYEKFLVEFNASVRRTNPAWADVGSPFDV